MPTEDIYYLDSGLAKLEEGQDGAVLHVSVEVPRWISHPEEFIEGE